MATAQYLIDQIRQTLNDTVNVTEFPYRWSDAELLRWISDGQREVVKAKPEASAVTELYTPVDIEAPCLLNADTCHKVIRVEANNVAISTVVPSPPVDPLDAWTHIGDLVFDADETLTLSYPAPVGASVANRSVTVFVFVSHDATALTRRVGMSAVTYGGLATLNVDVTAGGTSGSQPPLNMGVASLQWENTGEPANGTLSVTGNIYLTQAQTVQVWARTFNNVEFVLQPPVTYGSAGGPQVKTLGGLGIPAQSATQPGDYSFLLFGISGNLSGGATLADPEATLETALDLRWSDSYITNGYVTLGDPLDLTKVTSAKSGNGYYVFYERADNVNGWPAAVNYPPYEYDAPSGTLYEFQQMVRLTSGGSTTTTVDSMGPVVRLVQRDVLDSFYSAWRTTQAGTPAVDGTYYKAWAPDAHDPRAFYLYPAAHSSYSVWVTYAKLPADVGIGADLLTLSDQYLDALRDYAVFRAYLKRASTFSMPAAMAAAARFAEQLSLSRQIITDMTQRATSEGPVTP